MFKGRGAAIPARVPLLTRRARAKNLEARTAGMLNSAMAKANLWTRHPDLGFPSKVGKPPTKNVRE
jgi:hypothetical protein